MWQFRVVVFSLFIGLVVQPAFAKKLSKIGGLEVHLVTENIYAFVGELGQRSPENLGNNATFGLVVTSEGAVLIDSGGSRKGAIEIEKAILSVTDKPVKYVINTGGQDHRWFGNEYFRSKGAKIISSVSAMEDQEERTSIEYAVMAQLIGYGIISGTEPETAEINFEEKYEFSLGGVKFEIHVLGGGHSAGDSFVWLANQKLMFGGDIVFTERLLALREISSSGEWIKSFEALSKFNPEFIIPGHGRPTTMAQARKETYDYLIYLRKTVKAHINNEGALSTVVGIDQSKWQYMAYFKELARRNAMAVYDEMEFE